MHLTVVLPNGDTVKTGGGPGTNVNQHLYYNRYFGGPDFTGLFIGDGGSFGIKTEATIRLLGLHRVTRARIVEFDTLEKVLELILRHVGRLDPHPFDPLLVFGPGAMETFMPGSGDKGKFTVMGIMQGHTVQEVEAKLAALDAITTAMDADHNPGLDAMTEAMSRSGEEEGGMEMFGLDFFNGLGRPAWLPFNMPRASFQHTYPKLIAWREKRLEEAARKGFECTSRFEFFTPGDQCYLRGEVEASFFLEANTTPSLEPLEALSLSAKWAGLDYPGLVERMLSAALRRYGNLSGREEQKARIDLPPGAIELRVPQGVHFPPPSSVDLAKILDVKAGERVLDLGCGTGLLSIVAAKLGARRVVATDLDPQALDSTAHNARANGVEGQIEVRAGSWYDALEGVTGAGEKERFEVIVATPPQTPGPNPFGPRYGGWDGTRHLSAVIEGAPRFLEPYRGRLWLLAISLANPAALLKRLHEHFSEVSVVKETDRGFTAGEYESIAPGLFKHFLSLRSSGQAEFKEAGGGKYMFRNLFLRAAGVKKR